MAFVPLTSAWGRDGSVLVVVSALEDAEFHPIIECDPRGPMHYYGWPFGSSARTTVWVPEDELQEAAAFLQAQCATSDALVAPRDDLYGSVRAYRRWIYVCWLFQVVSLAVLAVLVRWLRAAVFSREPADESVAG